MKFQATIGRGLQIAPVLLTVLTGTQVLAQGNAAGATNNVSALITNTSGISPNDTATHDNVLLSGVVVEYPAGRHFSIRAAQGLTYAVEALFVLPQNFTAGDLVRVWGDWRRSQLLARNIRIVREGDFRDISNADRTVDGIVVSSGPGARFAIRSINGFAFEVITPDGTPDNLRVGAEVLLRGEWTNGLLRATNIQILSATAPPAPPSSNARVNIPGRATAARPARPRSSGSQNSTPTDSRTTRGKRMAATSTSGSLSPVASSPPAGVDAGPTAGLLPNPVVVNVGGTLVPVGAAPQTGADSAPAEGVDSVTTIVPRINSTSRATLSLQASSPAGTSNDLILPPPVEDVIQVDENGEIATPEPDVVARTGLGAHSQVLTRTGTIIGTPVGSEFMLMTARGRTYRVRVGYAPPMKVHEGDQLRVYGIWSGGVLTAANMRLLGSAKSH